MELSVARTSPFRKNSKSYFKDHIFDIIDVEEQLNQNRTISLCDAKNFIFNIFKDNNKNPIKDENTSINETYNLNYKLENGTLIPLKSEFIIYKIIGNGSYGLVLSVYDKVLQRNAALKVIQKEKLHLPEIDLHKFMDHPNLIKLYRVLSDNNYVFLVMELMEGGSLRQLIKKNYKNKKPFKETEISIIMNGIMAGLEYMHINKILHRDIKPENIMFKNKDDLDSLKIVDFGLANIIEDPEKIYCGTKLYMAPEMFMGIKSSNKVDVWACGFVLYILCSGGRHPVIRSKEYRVKENYLNFLEDIKENGWKFNDEYPLLARNLFLKLCKFDYSKRFEIFCARNHPYVTRKVCSIPLSTFENFERKRKIRDFSFVLLNNIVSFFFNSSRIDQVFTFCKKEKE